ncbi:hypothetical protein [Moorena sp. SIO4G3]|uniref:hypothetical protein n=1 Tax=Moorena sp. SIO4G3 TaxID=2607821 RepID=UPI00142B1892|nr:hypothetical protein [Moorena sp. SIO4G3]NEO78682.1 hypothetical protein [Moorena sp. SIO4G3]
MATLREQPSTLALAFGPRYANGHATRTTFNLQPNNLQPNNLQPNNLQPNNLQPNNLQPNNLKPDIPVV